MKYGIKCDIEKISLSGKGETDLVNLHKWGVGAVGADGHPKLVGVL